AMLAVADRHRVGAGEMLYRKGDGAGAFFGVVRGVFKVSTLGADGREGILSMLEAGNWFGETTLLDGLPRPHDVTAVQGSEVLVIGPAAFARLLQRPAFSQAMHRLLCSRVRTLYTLVEDSMLRSTSVRVTRRLLALARGDATLASSTRASVAVSQEALAMMLGLTRQTLSRELKRLVRAGAVALAYGRIEIVCLPELERLAALG
ncbi:MAG: Crp/Fnr family transcriptional regulator, partial [Rhodoferax sp.]